MPRGEWLTWCSMPRSPANPQQPQASATTTSSATASAQRCNEAFQSIRVDEHVGWSAADATLGSPGMIGRTSSATYWTASTTRMSLTPSYSSSWTKPSEQLTASEITVSSPSRVDWRMMSTTRRRIVAYPCVIPLDFHGVPQHSELIPSGTVTPIPAAVSREIIANSVVFSPGMTPPNMVLTQAAGTPPRGVHAGRCGDRSCVVYHHQATHRKLAEYGRLPRRRGQLR